MILQTFLLALVLRSSLVSGTEFHLSPRQARSGRSLDIVFTDPFQPLCTNPANMNHLELFGHHVCTSAGYKTFSDLVFAHISNIKVDLSEERPPASQVNCSQSSHYQISCDVSPLETDCEYLVSLTCSSCHDQMTVSPGSLTTILSPLYPSLQPDFICEYELTSESDQLLDFTLAINDLSLPAPHLSQTNTGHCLQSFVQVESGNSGHDMTKVSSLCGEVSETITASSTRRLRILFVSGPEEEVGGHRGFNFTISSSSAKSKVSQGEMAGYVLSVVVVLALLGGGCLYVRSSKRSRRRRRPRRGVTWHGPVPRPGQSLHDNRTSSLRRVSTRDLRAVEANPSHPGRTGEENIYEVEERAGGGAPPDYTHYSVPVRGGRTLPPPPDTPTVTVTSEDLQTHHHHHHHHHHGATGDKIYESLGSLSSPHHPEVPARPPWTFSSLQLPGNVHELSPLYLDMPGFQSSQPQRSEEKKVSPSPAKTSLPVRRVSSAGRRQSLSEAGKQFLRGMSLSMARPDKFDTLIDENEENESDNDDVFC